ncbi:alpha/beta fold hydrolase [Sandaracinus amylolyticus]|uniref:Beta-ketoadipate enol-lactone hydrolase n=1 Tax=Sandaracinus amylolyticus TaxID=927083 RepID=A0A0F6SF26_9BACT|nr:alpha/beta fold hydrolase [Sandaracinus amylolyticus]AKF06209.1 Beta-ketoadipate enol-lactone hydrolase [Sandaracinus amylolyticus]
MTEIERTPIEGGAFACVAHDGPRDAPAVVVIPPLGMPAAVVDPFVAHLATALRVVTIELPGAGYASGARAGWGTRDLARAVEQVLAAHAIPRAHLFGISLGGMIAQWVAIDHAERVDRLVLASTAAHGIGAALTNLPAKIVLAKAALSPEPGATLARAIVSDHVREDPDAMGRIEAAIAEQPRDAEEIAWLAAAAAAHDTRACLATIHAPTLILTGARDALIPSSVQDDLHAGITGAQRVTIDDAGHDVVLDQPRATADAVLAFLQRA